MVSIAAALALSGMTQYLVRFAYTNRQYNTYIAYGLFAVVLLAIAISVFCYFTSGAFLPTYAAILVINLFSVCFYFFNHPTMFEHCVELQSFLVISMDFFCFIHFIPFMLYPNLYLFSKYVYAFNWGKFDLSIPCYIISIVNGIYHEAGA